MKHTHDMKPKTKFGRWLLDKMLGTDFTCGDVAKELGTTRRCVRDHITGVTDPSFVWVIAYCWLFNATEDLSDIWDLTTEEEP